MSGWIHEPPSGWPGRPRNVGIEGGRGRRVRAVPRPGRLVGRGGVDAPVRGWARRNDSDIVIGKVTSDFRDVPFELLRTRPGVVHVRRRTDRDVHDGAQALSRRLPARARGAVPGRSLRAGGPLLHGPRLRPGQRRSRSWPAIPATSTWSVATASTRCRRRWIRPSTSPRWARSSSGSGRTRQPGVVRDQLLARYHGEMLGWLADQRFVDQDAGHPGDAWSRPSGRSTVRSSADRSDADLRPALRLRSELLRAGRADALLDLAERTGALVARCRLARRRVTGRTSAVDPGSLAQRTARTARRWSSFAAMTVIASTHRSATGSSPSPST